MSKNKISFFLFFLFFFVCFFPVSGSFADSLRESLKTAAIDEVAAMGAGEIGDEFASGSMAGGLGSAAYWLHKGSHAALGCASASAKGGDCASGAFGGAAGEVFAEQLGKTGMSDKWLLASSRIATVFSAGAAVKDIKDADATASNAVQNNYLNHKEQFKRSQAKKACATGDMSACAKVEELNTLDETGDQILDEIRAECASEGPAGGSFNMMTEIADELTSVLNGYEENEGSFGSGSIREISSLENYLRIFKNDPYGEALQPGILAPEDLFPGKQLLKLGSSGTKILLRMLRKPATYRTAVQKSKNTWIVGPKGGRAKATNYRDKNEFVDLTTPARRKHILDGDATGGGHRPGTGKPGKSEFPAGRSDDSIIHDISDIATDPTLKSISGRGGRTITDGTRNGVNIRVIQEQNGDIVTGFPTNMPSA